MSNQIYKQDLHDIALAVAENSKNYIDKSIDNLKWELGTYDLGIESDNTSALTKTMPSGTIKLNANKIYGASEVSENLIVTSDFNTTWKGITLTVKDNKALYSGTAEDTIDLFTPSYTLPAGTYTFRLFRDSNYSVGFEYKVGGGSAQYSTFNTDTKTLTFNDTTQFRYYKHITINEVINYDFKIMAVSGTTAPSEFSVGYDGIHNLELTGLKVEGENILPTAYSEVTNGTTSGFTNTFNLSIKKGETISIKMFKESGTISLYNFAFYDGATWHNDVFAYNSNNDSYHQSSVTFSYDVTQCRIFCSFSNSPTFKVMLVRGSTAPTSFVPYIAPTTKTIDLSSILYNGSPLFEDNKMLKDDILTPYKATKSRRKLVFNGTENWQRSDTNDVTTKGYYFWLTVDDCPIVPEGSTVSDIIATHFVAGSPNSVYGGSSDNPHISYWVGSNHRITVYDVNLAFKTVEEFKTWLSTNNVEVDYLLATSIEVSIDWSNILRGIQGYSNGSITAQNTYDMAVSSEIDYLVEEVKA